MQDIDLPGVGSESQFNAGLGLRWNILDSLDARAAFNFYDGQDWGDLKLSFNLGLHYQFGRASAAQVVRRAPIDSDSDGVIDSQDVCLGTRAGVAVDIRGCALPADTDGDGVDDEKINARAPLIAVGKWMHPAATAKKWFWCQKP